MSNNTETYSNVQQPRLIFFTLLYQPDYPTAHTLSINLKNAFPNSDNIRYSH